MSLPLPPITLPPALSTPLVRLYCNDPRCRCATGIRFVSSARSGESATDGLRSHVHHVVLSSMEELLP